jgi:cell wall-associated NlpC family hydrolase
LVAACTLGLLAGPAAGSAYAAPPDPGGNLRELKEIGQRIDRLYERAEKATEAYNGAKERVEKQQKSVDRLKKKIKGLRTTRAQYTETAGALARAQYRAGGMPAEAHLVLRKTPEAFMHDMTILRKGQQATKGVVTTLAATEKRLDDYASEAKKKLRTLEKDKKDKSQAKKKIENELEKAEKIESRLAEDELDYLRRIEDAAAEARQSRWLESGVLDGVHGKPSKAGKKALAYAARQLGKDYEWGAEGPRTFDCSGLTLRAWQRAGEEIPRTSQEQWKQLDHVPIRKMRPGDLIIYKRDASHVAMYIGGGEMIHAPRTGRQITVAGAGSLLIKGVVRPDS